MKGIALPKDMPTPRVSLYPTSGQFCCSVLSRVWLCDLVDYSMPGSSVLHYLPVMSTESVMLSCLKFSPISQWCCLTISSSATLFSFGLQSFPASGQYKGTQIQASYLNLGQLWRTVPALELLWVLLRLFLKFHYSLTSFIHPTSLMPHNFYSWE